MEEAFFTLHQGRIRPLAFYHLRGLPGVKICQSQSALRRTMRLTKVRGDHAERFTIATEQRGGLQRPKTGSGGNRPKQLKIRVG